MGKKGNSPFIETSKNILNEITLNLFKPVEQTERLKVKHTSPQVQAPTLMGGCFCPAEKCNFSHQLLACRLTVSSDWSSTGFHSANHKLDP